MLLKINMLSVPLKPCQRKYMARKSCPSKTLNYENSHNYAKNEILKASRRSTLELQKAESDLEALSLCENPKISCLSKRVTIKAVVN